MALIIEDGTGKPDANAYDSVENVTAYLTARGRELVVTDAMVIQATQSLDNMYESLYCGVRKSSEQALAWPRVGSSTLGQQIPDDIVPQRVKNALAEMIYEVNVNGYELNPIIQRGIKRYMGKVDVLQEDIEFVGSGSMTDSGASGVVTSVINELNPLFCNGGGLGGRYTGIVRRY